MKPISPVPPLVQLMNTWTEALHHYASEHETTTAQLDILMFLHISPKECIIMTDLARHRRCSTAAMTGIIDCLEKKGHAKRRADPDRRRIQVALTPEGERLVAGALAHATQSVQAAASFWGVEDAFRQLSEPGQQPALAA